MLASIQRIKLLSSIPNADRIETAQILGWKCVVKKGEFSEDELVVFIEIDTLIPKWFLTDNKDNVEYIRLSTVKMKGQVSQGLVLKLNKFIPYELVEKGEMFEGKDITDLLLVKKYEKPLPAELSMLVDGWRPSFIPKTDETNIESEPRFIQDLQGYPFVVTTKLDGTSMSVANHLGNLYVCSRNMSLKDNGNIYWQVARENNLAKKILPGYCIQGELCGPGIHNNHLKLIKPEFFLFDVYDITNRMYFGYNDMMEMAYYLECKTVPLEKIGMSFSNTFDEVISWSDGYYDSEKKNRKEGIVIRCKRVFQPTLSNGSRISFKVVNKNYLLEVEK